MKMTKNRQAVLDVLEGKTKALSAEEINKALEDKGLGKWLSTTYRNLEALEKMDLIKRIRVPEDDKAYYVITKGHQHFALCLSCKDLIEDLACPMDAYKERLAQEDFNTTGHSFLIYGYCKNCR